MSLSPSDDLARTRVLFEQWRATRPGRSKIPDELWQAVVSLHGRYSASQLCRELHLSAGALRSHLQEAARAQPSSRPVFVPLSSPPFRGPAPAVLTAPAEEIRLVWERADGTRLHLCLPASQAAQLASLCTALGRS
jgi:hypothetical protein